MWGKHFASMYTGSMCGAGPLVFTVWGYVIAHTVDSQVELNPTYLAPILGMTAAQVQDAITVLCEPDPRSRSPRENGKRLIKQQGFSYLVPTHDIYRGIRNEAERREYFRIKKQEQRLRDVKASQSVSHANVKMSTHTEADTEPEAKAPESKTITKSVATRPRK